MCHSRRVLKNPVNLGRSAVILLTALLVLGACSDNDSGPTQTATVPTLTTAEVSGITAATAQCGGTITADGGAEVTARGVCWSESHDPSLADPSTSDGAGTGSFSSTLTGLTSGTTYRVRAYATNSGGTGYGGDQTFATPMVAVDIDGNQYQTVTIGTQVWMAENLKVTRYRNGDPVPRITDAEAWNGLSSGARCEYDNDSAHVAVYGRIYNWFAVGDARGLAPAGWHVATDAEWQTLVDGLGGYEVAGGKLKAAGTDRWREPNAGATNESGFTALPGGGRSGQGPWGGLGDIAGFWTATENAYISDAAFNRLLRYNRAEVIHDYSGMKSGESVRCVKD